jgi:D-glycero-D-manno-heptose 1,7-bisphosphate phosphatase
MNPIIKVDKSWTLFLDRDGVINERIFGGYILDWKDFNFTENALEAFKIFAQFFGKIVVVTNQQCISKGLISEQELDEIHQNMKQEIEKFGGRIDAVFAAKEIKNEAPFHRKPNPAMAYMAKEQFPEISFSKAIMVGDTDTDILFGKNLGMKTALVVSKEQTSVEPDMVLNNLWELTNFIQY